MIRATTTTRLRLSRLSRLCRPPLLSQFCLLTLLVLSGCGRGAGANTNTNTNTNTNANANTNTNANANANTNSGTQCTRRFSMDELSFAGAFRFTNGDFGVSNVNYAVGVLAYNSAHHSLFIVGHSHQSAVAEYPIPEPGMQSDVAALPESGPPIQPFVDLLSTGGNPEALDRITGMMVVDGSLIVNAEQWYDAPGDNVDTTLVVADASDLAGPRDGYFELDGRAESAGYLGAIPACWQEAFAARYYTGWSSVWSIISRYSIGPSLWTFEPDDIRHGSASTAPAIAATAFMNFPFGAGTQLSERGTEYEPQGTPGPFPPADPLWNPLSRGRYGFFVPGTRTFAVIGSTAGLQTGIGYKAVQEDGHVCGGPCPYGVDDYYNYYWLFDVTEILAADNPWEPRPYDYGVWEVPFDAQGKHPVIGGALDPEGRVLYVALGEAGQIGDYDRPPLIVTFHIP